MKSLVFLRLRQKLNIKNQNCHEKDFITGYVMAWFCSGKTQTGAVRTPIRPIALRFRCCLIMSLRSTMLRQNSKSL